MANSHNFFYLKTAACRAVITGVSLLNSFVQNR